MIERNPIREARLEFSRGSAFYPEWSSLFQAQEFERRFFARCRAFGKDSGMYLSGSPNHGEQRWTYQGESKLFSISNNDPEQIVKEEKWTRLDTLYKWLQTDTIALLTPRDVENANSIRALPIAFKTDVSKLSGLVTREGQNGIILVRP